jgi:hypothetical protein
MEIATTKDAPRIASLLTATSQRLTEIYGEGHWSHQTNGERRALWDEAKR